MIGFAGRILEGIGAGMVQTGGNNIDIGKFCHLAYGEALAQNKED